MKPTSPTIAFDVRPVRAEFPALHQRVYDKPFVYLDNAATTQKPRAVLDAIVSYYSEKNSNVHRGVHLLSMRATEAFEEARSRIQRFLGAGSEREIIFTRGTTEAINLVAQSFARRQVKPGDEILISAMEHHSNIVPWQLVCEETGARLRVVPITDTGELDLAEFDRLLGERTKLVSLVFVSNALGTINPVREMIQKAHARGVPVLLDGAQAVAHVPVDVRDLDCDFFAFSGHKVYGPTGIGVLYGKTEFLEAMPPYQGGGDMIRSVTFEKTTYNRLPYKFEAGTPNIAGAVGLGAALEYFENAGPDAVFAHEHELLRQATDAVRALPGVRIIGTARDKVSVLSFVVDGIHAHDIGTIVDRQGIAIRTGHHCAQPVMERYGVPATARASIGIYNTQEDIAAFVAGLRKAIEVFA